jgi:tRNA(Ile)-lysidine synthase
MTAAAGEKTVSFGHVDAALELLSVPRGRVDAPGHSVQRLGSRLVLSKRGAPALPAGFRYPLAVPGEVLLTEAGCAVAAELPEPGSLGHVSAAGTGSAAIVRMDLCPGPLAVRSRRPGDRFRPPGLRGRKKLQDFFVDRKVAAAARDRVPLVVDGADRIVWVAGYAIDEAFRVTDSSQTVLLLRLKEA